MWLQIQRNKKTQESPIKKSCRKRISTASLFFSIDEKIHNFPREGGGGYPSMEIINFCLKPSLSLIKDEQLWEMSNWVESSINNWEAYIKKYG